MTDRGAGCWESRLSGSERGWSATLDMDEILWHRRETRRKTENTNIILCLGESSAYSNMMRRISPKGRERQNRPTIDIRTRDFSSRFRIINRPLVRVCLYIGCAATTPYTLSHCSRLFF